jgi:aspartyl-tRNA(Asn)/glutamyl-tRNA(Gln) amidotransferase subunit B
MQEGSMRCDVNLSLREAGTKEFGTRTETKNINSLNYIYKAMKCEIERQTEILEDGRTIIQQTMRYDDSTETISPMREKENSDDYRYFPDPDILRFSISDEKFEEIKNSLPELPFDKLNRYISELNMPEATAKLMFRYKKVCSFFEEALANGVTSKNAANLITGTIYATLSTEEDKEKFEILPTAEQFAALVKLLDEKKISLKMAQDTLQKMLESGKDVSEYIKAEDLAGVSEADIANFCKAAVEANPKAVEDIKAGKDKAMNVLMGYVMKQTRGKADVKKAEEIIRSLIS